jgi:hypothetical protein
MKSLTNQLKIDSFYKFVDIFSLTSLLVYLDTPDFNRHKNFLKLFQIFDFVSVFPNFCKIFYLNTENKDFSYIELTS